MDVVEASSGQSSPTANTERIVMQWLDRARSIARGIHGISLPDPDRIDIGAVPDTVALLEAIDAAMPRAAVVELIGVRHDRLAAFLDACPDASQHRVVWLSRRQPKPLLRRFLEALSPGSVPAPRAPRPIPLLRPAWRMHALSPR
jgi:hypothetical protein